MASGEHVEWRNAIDLELGAMVDLDVWDIVQIPVEHSLLGTIWVFCKKVNSDGVISKFKAQLCAQGSFQIPRQDFKETYAPTGRFADLGELNLLLGVKKVYTNKILADHKILNAQPVSTPMQRTRHIAFKYH
ncbi:uncharacterized protein VP01_9g8 [Puccinia sorghi]|uniref:Reverse transcriptase Ty1/copia-type domain-containing protein n=1 Tax=Puccinia sorghi TaxID=27349 RepID=A0A0L6U755_9BASI|nr:uncharacterized protein VP01_9g8 [Puccinia sorghi]